MIWFIYIGKVNVVKNVSFGNKVKPLKIDTLGSTDIFGHHRITSDWKFDYTIITQLPSEFFGITKNDFLSLPEEIKKSFYEYAKPYPTSEVIKKNFYDNKKWVKFSEMWRKNIQNEKYNQTELRNPFLSIRGEIGRLINPVDVLKNSKKKKQVKVKDTLSDVSSISTEIVTTIPSVK